MIIFLESTTELRQNFVKPFGMTIVPFALSTPVASQLIRAVAGRLTNYCMLEKIKQNAKSKHSQYSNLLQALRTFQIKKYDNTT